MDRWVGWPYARVYLILVAVAFLVIGAQVFLFHWRAAFRSKAMYGPVLMAPVISAAGLLGAATRDGWIGWTVAAVFALGVLDGLLGIALHVRGVARRVGGFTLRNLLDGPPVLLAVAFTALAVTGGLAVLWPAP